MFILFFFSTAHAGFDIQCPSVSARTYLPSYETSILMSFVFYPLSAPSAYTLSAHLLAHSCLCSRPPPVPPPVPTGPTDPTGPTPEPTGPPTTRPTTPHYDFTCPEPYGLFRDPYDCGYFYSCNNGMPYHMACPSNLVYNPATERCDYSKNVPGC